MCWRQREPNRAAVKERPRKVSGGDDDKRIGTDLLKE